LDLFHDYFLSLTTLVVFGALAVTYLVSYAFYSLNNNDPARRSRLLQPMIIASLSSWSFLGASLLLCVALLSQYDSFPDMTIREVLGGSLVASLGFVTSMTLVARKHVFARMLEGMTTRFGLPSIGPDFGLLSSRMGVRGVSLRGAKLGSAFSISMNGRGVVAVSPDLTKALSSDETEAVFAHELSHIKNGDSNAKGLARIARIAFPFDPALRLVEAAVHRERELWADRIAVEYTGKPLALASALVKANSLPKLGTSGLTAGLFVGGNGQGLLSFYPNLEKRVDVLLELAQRMKVASSSPIAA
jgi:Zn-dependent protease with chaperone function